MIGKDEEFIEDNRNLFSELASFESNYLIRWTDVDDTFISIIIATLFILNSLFLVDGNWNGIILGDGKKSGKGTFLARTKIFVSC